MDKKIAIRSLIWCVWGGTSTLHYMVNGRKFGTMRVFAQIFDFRWNATNYVCIVRIHKRTVVPLIKFHTHRRTPAIFLQHISHSLHNIAARIRQGYFQNAMRSTSIFHQFSYQTTVHNIRYFGESLTWIKSSLQKKHVFLSVEPKVWVTRVCNKNNNKVRLYPSLVPLSTNEFN